jgi:hypothetical protein
VRLLNAYINKGPTPPNNPGCFLPVICYQFDQGMGPNIHAGFVYFQGPDPSFGWLYVLPEKEYLRAFRYHHATGHVDETPAMTADTIRVARGMPGEHYKFRPTASRTESCGRRTTTGTL